MTSLVQQLPRGATLRLSSQLWLSGLFLAFCYALLSWRSLLLDQSAPVFSEHRLLVLLVGTGLFWLAIERIDRVGRVTLARIASWIVAATAAVLVVRTVLDWLIPGAAQQFSYDLRWSLAWGGYFGMWVMGTMTFRRRDAGLAGAATDAAVSTEARATLPAGAEMEWLMDTLGDELAALTPGQREAMATRVLARAGGYEIADERDPFAAAHNARVALAARLSRRLTH